MKRAFLILASLALLLGAVGQGQAGTITVNFPEYNGDLHTSGFPLPPVVVSTQTYSVAPGSTVTGASISGIFGQTSQFSGSTAEFDLLINGVQVGSTFDVTPDPFNNVVPFNFNITNASVLSSLQSGSATLSVVQESEFIIRLSASTLSINVSPASAVPEPSSFALLGIGAVVSGAFGWKRKRQSALELV